MPFPGAFDNVIERGISGFPLELARDLFGRGDKHRGVAGARWSNLGGDVFSGDFSCLIDYFENRESLFIAEIKNMAAFVSI